jgi:hypothetical protein
VHRAELSQLMQPRRSNCKNTEGGAMARGAMRMAAGKMLPTREADAWGRAPGATERLLPKELLPPRGRQAREAGQEDPAKSFVTHRCPRSRLGHHAPRLRGERGRGLGKYHLRRKDHHLILHLRLDKTAGVEAGQAGEGEGRSGQSECSHHADRFPPTQEGCQAHYN